MKKIEEIIQFPSIENAKTLINYTKKNSAYSEKDIYNCKMEKFKARALQIAGIVLIIGAYISALLIVPTGGWSLLGVFFGAIAGGAALNKAKPRLDNALEAEELLKEKVESPFNKTKYTKSQSFLTHLASIGKSADMVGSCAYSKLLEQRKEEENKALMNFMKVQVC